MRLKELRTEKNLSQGQLARMGGVSQAYISDLEANRANPTITVAIKLANALGVSLMELIGDPNEYVRKAGEKNNTSAG
jgi:transcriptional regulator with XRE-family HTH domain